MRSGAVRMILAAVGEQAAEIGVAQVRDLADRMAAVGGFAQAPQARDVGAGVNPVAAAITPRLDDSVAALPGAQRLD